MNLNMMLGALGLDPQKVIEQVNTIKADVETCKTEFQAAKHANEQNRILLLAICAKLGIQPGDVAGLISAQNEENAHG